MNAHTSIEPQTIDWTALDNALRSSGVGCRFGICYPDEFFDHFRYCCEMDCEGVPFGRVIAHARTLEDAFFLATVKREDARKDKQCALI
jgi:hypothetical protein